MRFSRTLFLATTLTLTIASSAEAQRAQSHAFRVANGATAPVSPSFSNTKKTHVVTGALVGTAISIGGLMAYFATTNDELFVPLALAPVVLGGATIGGIAGYVVWRIRR
jgi:4-hydroxybenzoate polyprenyltransferase